MEKVNKVIIFGGTHGNEMSGIFLVNKWKNNDEELKSRITTCPVDVHIANPEAVALCRRYKDCDLNRQFSEENYEKFKAKAESLPYEVIRAGELHSIISEDPKEKNPQLLLDLHNTTANTGCCLIVNATGGGLSMHLAAYIQSNMKKDSYKSDILYLDSLNYPNSRNLCQYGIGVEVGAQPQGVLRADTLKVQRQAVFYALEFVEKFNKGESFPSTQVNCFRLIHKVGFPDSCETTMIHENIQDKDCEPVSLSEPVFRKMNDEILCLNDVLKPNERPTETVYPVFVNEAAYYEKNMAFGLTVVKQLPVEALNAKC